MSPSKVIIAIVLLGVVEAEKKIELQDIEEDNLRNEKSYVKPEVRSQPSAPGVPLEHLKNNLIQYYEGPTPTPQQPLYIQQYAVTEPPERPVIEPKPEYGPPVSQQSMLGYISNMPVQFYLVPQYYNQLTEQEAHTQSILQIPTPTISQYQEPDQALQQAQQQVHQQSQQQFYQQSQQQVHQQPQQQVYQQSQQQVHQQPQQQVYQQSQQQVHPPANYIEIPAYITPTGNSYIQPYPSPVTYVSYSHPTAAPAPPNVTPVLAYQMPIVNYQNAITSPPQKSYYQPQQYTESKTLNEVQENEIDNQKQYLNHQEVQSSKPFGSGYPRYYNSRIPIREEYKTNPVQLPHPSPLLLKAPPTHLSHIPKTLPIHRPITKPKHTNGGTTSNTYTQRPHEAYSIPFKRRPTSLLDSYIPSSLQIEYLKRGLATDSLSAYEALASGRHLSQSQFIPRRYERGFLPNQMYHTAAGGITFEHHKRAQKREKVNHK